MSEPREVSPSQAAALLGASTRSVQRWIAEGRLPARRVGGRWRVVVDATGAIGAFVSPHIPTTPAHRPGTPIRTLLVANRGEIAARIRRTCDRLGIRALVPGEDGRPDIDLLDPQAVVAAALAAGADAVHPGVGFLSENADFGRRVSAAGLRWVGPPPAAIGAMGDKAAARRLAAGLGIPVISGYDGTDQSDAALTAAAERIGVPLLVKPAAGGGGKGMRVVRDLADLPAALASSRREAASAFGDDRVILERYLEGPRHVEVQVLFDAHGAGVHLGERDCSVQRRHQKVLEESPSPAVDADLRRRLGEAALALGRAVGYVGAGTCEFLLDDRGFFFLEMNTRLQVEHPVTETVTGRDIVADQLRIAAGESLGFDQAAADAARQRGGHALEVRLYAEDADAGFLPATGRVEALRWPSGHTVGPRTAQDSRTSGIRVDAGIELGTVVGDRYDPLLAKLVAGGRDRGEALANLTRALDDTTVLGLTTNLRFLRWLVRQPAVLEGAARVDTLERIWPTAFPGGGPEAAVLPSETWAVAATLLAATAEDGGWRLNAGPRIRLVSDDGTERSVGVERSDTGSDPRSPTGDGPGAVPAAILASDGTAHVDVGGRSVAFRLAPPPDIDRAVRAAVAHHVGGTGAVLAPMPGAVLAVHVEAGTVVESGDALVTLEAMKMEHVVTAPGPGTIAEVAVRPADQVTRGQLLVQME